MFKRSLVALVVFVASVFSLQANSFSRVSLDEMARFLAGKSLPSGSRLSARTRSGKYRWYKNRMNRYWRRYYRSTVAPIRVWRRRWMSGMDRKFCFYPFSGADFINAYNFFPNAKTYLMIGLEKAGRIPNLYGMSRARLNSGMDKMVRGYRVFMNYNFYRTLGMAVWMDKSTFVGTIPHILSQMGWLGLKPVAAYKVGVSSNGKLTFRRLHDSRYCKGIAIDFIAKNGQRKRVIYLSLDIRNSSLRAKPAWRRYLSSLSGTSGFLKAATCLPPRHNYTIINRIMLRAMDTIAQSDSGIAYRHLKRNFNIMLFGRYYRAHPLFPSWSQPQLRRAYRGAKYRHLPFRFSYDRPNKKLRNMMLVRRK